MLTKPTILCLFLSRNTNLFSFSWSNILWMYLLSLVNCLPSFWWRDPYALLPSKLDCKLPKLPKTCWDSLPSVHKDFYNYFKPLKLAPVANQLVQCCGRPQWRCQMHPCSWKDSHWPIQKTHVFSNQRNRKTIKNGQIYFPQLVTVQHMKLRTSIRRK